MIRVFEAENLPLPLPPTYSVTHGHELDVRRVILWHRQQHFAASVVESSWNVMAHGDAREGKWRGNWRMEWVVSTLHTTSEHGASTITATNVNTSAASSRLNWRTRRLKWTRSFRRKTKSGFCAWAITFQTQSTSNCSLLELLGPGPALKE